MIDSSNVVVATSWCRGASEIESKHATQTLTLKVASKCLLWQRGWLATRQARWSHGSWCREWGLQKKAASETLLLQELLQEWGAQWKPLWHLCVLQTEGWAPRLMARPLLEQLRSRAQPVLGKQQLRLKAPPLLGWPERCKSPWAEWGAPVLLAKESGCAFLL